jgi:hypothetical protein
MDICKISTTYMDQNYRTMTILAAVAAIPGAAFAALQLCAPLTENAAKLGDVLTCIAFLVSSLSLRLHRSARPNVFILDAIGSLALAFTFAVFLTGLILHPSTTGDAGEVVVYIFPAILFFLAHSFMALVRFQD